MLCPLHFRAEQGLYKKSTDTIHVMLAKNVTVLCLCPESFSEDEFTDNVVLSLTEKTHGKIVQANAEELSVINREMSYCGEVLCSHWKNEKLFTGGPRFCFLFDRFC